MPLHILLVQVGITLTQISSAPLRTMDWFQSFVNGKGLFPAGFKVGRTGFGWFRLPGRARIAGIVG